jgi:hypothetical protein
MKVAAVEIWGSVFGEDVKVKTFEGKREDIIEYVLSLTPAHAKDRIACAKALEESVWSQTVQWFGSHTVGLMVTQVSSMIPQESL